MAKKKQAAPKSNPLFQELTRLIADYAQASVDESWKGGGDPADVEIIELELELARAKLNAHLEKMRRELT